MSNLTIRVSLISHELLFSGFTILGQDSWGQCIGQKGQTEAVEGGSMEAREKLKRSGGDDGEVFSPLFFFSLKIYYS